MDFRKNAKIVYVTGGERSGKSRHAMQLATQLSKNPIYLATARKWDSDFQKRIERHKSERDLTWRTIEEEKYPSKLNLTNEVVVMDCVTLWLTNFFMDTNHNQEESQNKAKEEFRKLILQNFTLIIISNEIGMGVHAETEMGRKFVELQGWMNQFIAALADEAYLLVSGIPLKIKG